MSLADTGLTSTVDTGAIYSLYPPDIPTSVAAPSFDPTINYIQGTVPGVPGSYDPTGMVQTSQAVDATQAGIINGQTMPISTEDAVAYSATLGGAPTAANLGSAAPLGAAFGTSQYFDPGSTLIKNSSGLAGAQSTVPVAAGAGQPNPAMHGIADALTSLVNVGVAVDTLANVKNPTQTQGTATPMAQGVSGLLSPLTAKLQTPPLFSAATVPGPGGVGGLTISPMLLILAGIAVYFMVK